LDVACRLCMMLWHRPGRLAQEPGPAVEGELPRHGSAKGDWSSFAARCGRSHPLVDISIASAHRSSWRNRLAPAVWVHHEQHRPDTHTNREVHRGPSAVHCSQADGNCRPVRWHPWSKRRRYARLRCADEPGGGEGSPSEHCLAAIVSAIETYAARVSPRAKHQAMGPRAKRRWSFATQRGIKFIATMKRMRAGGCTSPGPMSRFPLSSFL